MKTKFYHLMNNQKFIFVVFLLSGGFLSSVLQYEIVWDFMNYHYYNAWAFVHNRFNKDILMAGVNGFFNPLPDVPLYYLIKYFNDFPALISFLQGLWFGILMYVTYRVIVLYFNTNELAEKVKAFVCFLIALTGNATFFQIGASSNEVMLAVFYLLSFYILSEEIFVKQSGRKLPFIMAGFILGAAMGLKLTGVIYCIVSGAALILFHKKIKNSWQNIAWFTLFGLLGFLLFSGFWMWKLWQEFQNPFFPFANSWFKSEWFVHTDFSDKSFTPQNWKEFLLWPVFLCLTLHREEGHDMFVADFRLLLVYIIFIYMVLKILYLLVRRQKIVWDAKWLFLSFYLLLSYLIWAYFFSISRYFIIGEILMALIVVQVCFSLHPTSVIGKGIYYSFLLLLIFILSATPYFSEDWGNRGNWKLLHFDHDSYIGVEKVNIPDNALIQTYNYPTAALFAFWADKNPSLQGVNIFQQVNRALYPDGTFFKDYYQVNPHWKKLRQETIDKHKGPKFLLVANGFDGIKLNMDFSKIKEVKGMRCHFLRNNMLPYISFCAPREIADEVFVNNEMKIYEDVNEK